ncbi:MAG: lipopolysaccharide biosynthesis protein [Thermoanaerobaculia bacterium]
MARDLAAVAPAGMIASAPATRVLDRTLLRGVTWTGGIKGVTLLLSWACTIIVARLLSPADYGLVAMATVYLGLTTMVTDFGLGTAIVALRDLNEELTAQLHAVTALVGIASFGISCLVAVPLSRFFGAPALVPVVVVLSTALVLDSLRTVPTALLARELRFKYLSLLEGFKVLVAVAFTLILAASGAGYWALVLGNVFAALVITVFVLARLPQRSARPRFRTLKSALTFSSHFLMGQLAWYGYSNADFVVAGRVLGRIALGNYTLAWTLTSAPGDKIMAIFGRVMPMMLAAVQRDTEALRRYFFLFTEALAILIVPASVGLALVAPDFVLLVFGSKWAAAVVPLQLLCFYTAIHILATPTTPVLQVTGQASFPARCGMLTLFILPPAFYFAGTRWGTLGIAAIWLSVYPLVLIPVYVRVFRTLHIRVRDYLACVGPTLVSAVVMAILVLTIRTLAPAAWPLGARFGLQVASGAAAFVAAALFIQRRRLGVLADFFRTIRS